MDDIVLRSRYPRHGVSGRRRKRYAGENSRLNVLLARQIFISLLILLLAFITRNAESPVASFIKNNIRFSLTQNLDIGAFLASVEELIDKSWNAGNIDKSGSDGQADASDEMNSSTEKETSLEATDLDADDGSTAVNGGETSVTMLTVPLKGTVTSAFGERIDSVTGEERIHQGVDIDAEKGAAIKAALPGTVTEAGNSKTYGKYVKIAHQGNLETVYAHCSVILVTKGQKVSQGEKIAEVGNTGVSLGDHLHFEIWKNGKAVNPLDYVSISSE